MTPCPLCAAPTTRGAGSAHGRVFLECPHCALTFVHPDQRPAAADERARYEQHQNDPRDPSYRAFLSRLLDPLLPRLRAGAKGLDYGSGPGPTLSLMLEEAGHPTAIYDPYFAPDDAVLEATYDFVTCTETVEHFFQPGAEFDRLDRLLRPDGWLAVMTTMRDDDQPLAEWWYARDPTHVCFYAPRTMTWIAGKYGWDLQRPHPNVTLFHKPA